MGFVEQAASEMNKSGNRERADHELKGHQHIDDPETKTMRRQDDDYQ